MRSVIYIHSRCRRALIHSFIAPARLSFGLISHSPLSVIPSFPADKENLLRFILLLLAPIFLGGSQRVRARLN